MQTIPAKTMITKTKSPDWFGTDYNMNLYRGCCHGCIYCDSRSECYHVDDFDTVKIKETALEIIQRDLRAKTKTGVIGTGAMSDPYNPFEKEQECTRQALALVQQHGFGIAIATKSPLVSRDSDILQQIQTHAPVLVKITVTTADDALCKKIEPHVAPASMRFSAMKALSDQGVYCGTLLMPTLPFINDNEENILKIVQLSKESGARFVFPSFGVTLRSNQRAYYYQKLDTQFPGLKARYIARYGDQYGCVSPNVKALWRVFQSACERLGLFYKMKDIIRDYKTRYEYQQLSLFDF